VYRKVELAPKPPSEFELPFGGSLSPDNRWVKMAQIIPWSEFESEYAANFPADKGAPAKSFRMALGALIIKEKLGISARARGRTDPGKPLSAILYRSIKL
jgi:transposase, IS5 family